ncbi:MAG: hypothetical protein J7K45_00440 [Thaumarchaeota archaeon]|nr:hypothetical protein [Nitrososphaerota archaeon]
MVGLIEYEFELLNKLFLLLHSVVVCELSDLDALKLTMRLMLILFQLFCVELVIRADEARERMGELLSSWALTLK